MSRRARGRRAGKRRKWLRELCYMRCPRCGMELFPLNYRGLRVETCPTCHGMWIDQEWLTIVTNGRSSAAVLQPLLQYLLLGRRGAAPSDEAGLDRSAEFKGTNLS